MKAAPVIKALGQYPGVCQLLVHTGQHYDANMSELFFRELALPEPDVNLEVGSSSHAVQTADIMTRFDPVLLSERPHWVIVYGDVNSTIAAALVAVKRHIPVAHVEAGLRSRDRTMPEEINRLLTDQIADLLFTPSADGDENLLREGVVPEKIQLVGNVMIDTLIRLLPAASARWPTLCAGFNLDQFILVSLHRPSNVDVSQSLSTIMAALHKISHDIPILFPVHPRTRQHIEKMNLHFYNSHLQLVDPLGYLDFLALQQQATLVITDSGGIQEETTFLRKPCLTVRENTERPITVTMGSNILIGQDMDRLHYEVKKILAGNIKLCQTPPLWDGEAGKRVAQIMVENRS